MNRWREKCNVTVWDYAGINADPSAILTSEGCSQQQGSSVPSSLALMMDYIKDSKAAIQGEEI